MPSNKQVIKSLPPPSKILLACLSAFFVNSVYAKADIYGQWVETKNTNVTGQTLNVSQDANGVVGGYSNYYESRPWYSYTNQANNNAVTVTSGNFGYFETDYGTNVAVAGGYANRAANENVVTIQEGTFSGGDIYGGYIVDNKAFDGKGSATGNEVSLSNVNGTIELLVGGYANSDSKGQSTKDRMSVANNNQVSIHDSNINIVGTTYAIGSLNRTLAVAGGIGTHEASGNYVSIGSGTTNGWVLAGYVSLADGTASDNTTEITGGTINGTIYAAYSHSGTLLSNKVILAGNADVNGDVYINGIQAPTNVDHSGSMEVFGSALLDGASLHGYVPENESSSNGGHYELSIHDYSGKIHSLDNFNNVEIKDSIATIELADGQMFGGGGSFNSLKAETSFTVKNSQLSVDKLDRFDNVSLENSQLTADYWTDSGSEQKDLYKNKIKAINSDITINKELTNYDELIVQNASTNSVSIQKIRGNSNSSTNIQSGNVEILSDINVVGGSFEINTAESSKAFNAKILGNVTARSNGKASLGFNGENSLLRGKTSNGDNSGSINLAFKDNAVWQVTESSDLSSLEINNAKVDLSYNSEQSDYKKLFIDSLTGSNGQFIVNTDLETDQTDQIIIQKGSGAHQLFVKPSGQEPSKQAMDSFIVKEVSGSATFDLGNKNNLVEHGLYFYELASKTNSSNENEWYLRRFIEPTPQPEPDVPSEPETPTGETEAALSGLGGHYALWYGQQTDLRRRLGEMHEGTQTGVWARGFMEKDRYDGLGSSSVSQRMYGGSIGYDSVLGGFGQNKWIFGFQVRNSHGKQNVNGRWDGRGTLDSFGAGIYSTWINQNGWYADWTFTADWYDHKIRATMLDGTKVRDDRSSFGLGTSLEGGVKIDFAHSNDGNDFWFFEPQVQLAYFWVRGRDFASSNGMKIDQNDMDSLTLRVGYNLGKKITLSNEPNNRYVQPYLKAGITHEFLGDQTVTLNSLKMKSELDDTRLYAGIGVDWQALENMRLYLQAEKEHGDHFSRDYNISAGLKWQF